MGYQVKTNTIIWISMEELIPPKNWTLPFHAVHNKKHYLITGADYPARQWKAEDMSVENHTANNNKM